MNIILVEAEEIQDKIVQLSGRRAEHLSKILRCQCGDMVRIGIVGGNLGFGEVVAISKKPYLATLRIDASQPPPPRPAVDLILALPRPIMLKRILSQAAALGVGHISLIHSRRVEKSFWQSNLLEKEEYNEHLLLGLEQAAVDTRLPEISFHRRFKPFVEDVLPDMMRDYAAAILAHPPKGEGGTGDSIAELLGDIFACGSKKSGNAGRQSDKRRILLAVGPEGGWIDYEVEKFCRLGFVCGSMGERILKVDTAVVVLLGLVGQM